MEPSKSPFLSVRTAENKNSDAWLPLSPKSHERETRPARYGGLKQRAQPCGCLECHNLADVQLRTQEPFFFFFFVVSHRFYAASFSSTYTPLARRPSPLAPFDWLDRMRSDSWLAAPVPVEATVERRRRASLCQPMPLPFASGLGLRMRDPRVDRRSLPLPTASSSPSMRRAP